MRYFSLLPVFACISGCILMFSHGSLKTYKAAMYFFEKTETGRDLNPETISLVIGAMDSFLVAIVLLIFAGGIYELFFDEKHESTFIPDWLRVRSVGHLKHILCEVIILVLCVQFVDMILQDHLKWEMTILPLSIVCLSASLRLLDMKR